MLNPDPNSPPPRGQLFTSEAAAVVWPAILALPEAVKHDVYAALGEHLAISEDRSTPTAQRIASAVRALREAHDIHMAGDGFGPLTVEIFRALRFEHPEMGWPADGSVRRWLGGSWNDALRRAHLETVPDGDTLKVNLGGALTPQEACDALRECARMLDRVPSYSDYRHWIKTPDVLRLPGRRPMSQHPFERLFGSWNGALSAAGLIEETQSGVIALGYSIRPSAYRYTGEQVSSALRECAQFKGRSPRTAEYQRWREEQYRFVQQEGGNPVARPSHSVILRIHGSWDAALVAAGLEALGGRSTRSNPTVRRGDGQSYTDARLLGFLAAAVQDKGGPLTVKIYERWRTEQLAVLKERRLAVRGRLPSVSVISDRFGGWRKALHQLAKEQEAGSVEPLRPSDDPSVS